MTERDDDATPQQGTAQDAKARFREALDRKQQTARRGEQGQPAAGGIHGSEVAGGKRTFRRKTG